MHSKKLIYVTLLKTVKQCKAHDSSPILLMAFPQVIAAFLALLDVIGLPGNLIVLLTIILDSRFHVNAIYFTCQPYFIGLFDVNPRKLIPHRKYGTRKLVVWSNNV